MSVVVDLKSKLLSFHQQTEPVFQKLKIERVSNVKGILFFLIGVFLISLFSSPPLNSFGNFDFSQLGETQGFFFNKIFLNAFWFTLIFLFSVYIYQVLAEKTFKMKLKFVKIMYFYGIAGGIAFLFSMLITLITIFLNFISLPFPQIISYLIALFLTPFLAYSFVCVFRVLMNNQSYFKTQISQISVLTLNN